MVGLSYLLSLKKEEVLSYIEEKARKLYFLCERFDRQTIPDKTYYKSLRIYNELGIKNDLTRNLPVIDTIFDMENSNEFYKRYQFIRLTIKIDLSYLSTYFIFANLVFDNQILIDSSIESSLCSFIKNSNETSFFKEVKSAIDNLRKNKK